MHINSKNILSRIGLLPLLILLIISLTACNDSDEPTLATDTPFVPTEQGQVPPTAVATDQVPVPTTDPGTGQTLGQAYIDSLEINVLESFPIQVQAVVGGNLSDGCTTLEGINSELMGVTFVLTPVTSYSDTINCIQALIPFDQVIVPLDVAGLPAGTYSVAIGELSQTFEIPVDNTAPQATPDLGTASLSVTPSSTQSSETVTLTGSGFPTESMIEIGFGPVESEYDLIGSAQVDANGAFVTQLTVPNFAEAGTAWVFVAAFNNAAVISNPITITSNGTGGMSPDDGVNVAVNGRFTRTYMYLIAPEDGGQSGPMVGCNDSAVPVIIDIEPTIAPMTAAINRLLDLTDQYYGQSGLYNALFQSNLTLEGINIVNREAIISLTGDLQVGGVCDEPRLLAQLTYTAVQYTTVDTATILLNGQDLADQLGSQ